MRKLFSFAFLAAVVLSVASCSAPKVETSLPHKIKDGKIVLETPKRQPGQESALLMTCDPIETVRVGFIGLGMRGKDIVIHLSKVWRLSLCVISSRIM